MSEDSSSAEICGYWRGHATGTTSATVEFRIGIGRKPRQLAGQVLVVADDFTREYLELRGTIGEDGKSALVKIAHYSGTEYPGHAALYGSAFLFIDVAGNLTGHWNASTGTRGELLLTRETKSRASAWLGMAFGRLRISTTWMMKKWAPRIYLLGVLSLAWTKALGIAEQDVEVLVWMLLLIPLPFMFLRMMRSSFEYMTSNIKRLGPLEFQSAVLPSGKAIDDALDLLATEFRDDAVKLIEINKFLVPRTKTLLHKLVETDRAISTDDFTRFADALGVPPSNQMLTLEALVQSGCVTRMPDQTFAVTPLAKQLLRFDERYRAMTGRGN
jgi:hypothetical protein